MSDCADKYAGSKQFIGARVRMVREGCRTINTRRGVIRVRVPNGGQERRWSHDMARLWAEDDGVDGPGCLGYSVDVAKTIPVDALVGWWDMETCLVEGLRPVDPGQHIA